MAGVTFSTFAGQNWLITPVALAVNEPRPPSIVEQRWHIEFSGVGILDLKGNNPNDWRRETLVFFPDVDAPLKFAIARYSIPVPTTSFGTVSPSIVVDQIVPYVAVSSAFEKSSGGADFGLLSTHGDQIHFSGRTMLIMCPRVTFSPALMPT